MSDDFTYLHSSGRFSRTPASVRTDLTHWAAHHDNTLMTFTEFSGDKRLAAIANLPGWDVYNGAEHAGADDCVIAWRTDRWELLHTDAAVVSRIKTWRTNGKPIPPQYVTCAALRDLESGKTLLVSVSHLPSHVEVKGRLRSSNRSAKWRDSLRGWKRHLRDLRGRWHPDASLIVADWNVSLRGAWFRRLLGRRFPAMRPVWTKPYPKRGTLGGRIIDVPLIRDRIRVARRPQLLRTTSSDHTAFVTVVTWR